MFRKKKMVLHKRSAMPESVRRATLNQEMVRRMVNTSEMVDMEKRLEVVDNYAQKLINSEYSMKEARDIIIGGLKGYERLLSLSKDVDSPSWKPLHMSGKWNARNRRIAKQRSKTSWYKDRNEDNTNDRKRPYEICFLLFIFFSTKGTIYVLLF